MPISPSYSTRSLPAELAGASRLQEADRACNSRPLWRSLSGVSNSNSGSARSDRAPGPLAKVATRLFYGSETSRRALDPSTRAEVAMLENTGRATPVTLQGGAGRLEGYFHHGDAGAEHSDTGKVALFLQHPHTRCERQSLEVVAAYREKGIDVLAMNLRGFGDSEGVPTEAGLNEDARTCFTELLNRGFKAGDIILHGVKVGASLSAQQTLEAVRRGEAVWGTVLDRPMTGSRPRGFMGLRALGGIVPSGVKAAMTHRVGEYSIGDKIAAMPSHERVYPFGNRKELASLRGFADVPFEALKRHSSGDLHTERLAASERTLTGMAVDYFSRISNSRAAGVDVLSDTSSLSEASSEPVYAQVDRSRLHRSNAVWVPQRAELPAGPGVATRTIRRLETVAEGQSASTDQEPADLPSPRIWSKPGTTTRSARASDTHGVEWVVETRIVRTARTLRDDAQRFTTARRETEI